MMPIETAEDGLRAAAATFTAHPDERWTSEEVAFLLNTFADMVPAARQGDSYAGLGLAADRLNGYAAEHGWDERVTLVENKED